MPAIFKLAPGCSDNNQPFSRLVYICLALAVIINGYTAFRHFHLTALDFDAATYYLPYARQLLNDGLRFFAEEKSLRYPPLAYVYPALFGAEQLAVKIANIALSCFLVPNIFGLILYMNRTRVAPYVAIQSLICAIGVVSVIFAVYLNISGLVEEIDPRLSYGQWGFYLLPALFGGMMVLFHIMERDAVKKRPMPD